ncbi:MAG TPA: SirB2 family protein [Gallionella sp.]|nr:SirB2 family protein [Gallionella sp.]
MSYAAIKTLHISCVALSYSLFFLRGIWSLNNSSMLHSHYANVLPHVVDTVLLTSAITLAVMLGVSPLNSVWLLTKISALLLYIVLGSVAIRRGKTRRTKLTAWIAAQLVFCFIVATAITHSPTPWLRGT